MAKPDNRKDNVEHLQNAVQNTIENYREAEGYLEEFGDEIPAQEKAQIQEKNERRKHSISGFREEIKDEADHQSHS
ncbi:small acid-soluble spore protein Tlp [Paenibacillus shunpengii]|uniref:Small acid-soluble spore protein Tlp n=1 Tax=Paenibacillus shunpengii TaxID=2054424 RepID=A0ABW5SR29_9BACL|nr:MULTISPECIES: small acid-soluble spore protein Tlp [unclassified Paenibacillus]OMC67371.1 small acid-soluble spore protein Tlp [Paenibacillus sp. FSL H7-0326]SDW72089.1 small acid-soluble spore protein (thioredoxin-like protein) [Paenibacillus sp. PDC88]